MQENEYRLNVGVIVANKQGKLLLCKRKGINSWQFPQGGIDFGENSLKAAKRELFEELSIDVDIEDIIEFPNNILETENFPFFMLLKVSNEGIDVTKLIGKFSKKALDMAISLAL